MSQSVAIQGAAPNGSPIADNPVVIGMNSVGGVSRFVNSVAASAAGDGTNMVGVGICGWDQQTTTYPRLNTPSTSNTTIAASAGNFLIAAGDGGNLCRVVLCDTTGRLQINPVPTRGTFTDRSSSIVTGGTSQQLSPANANRIYITIQNNSTADLWINFTSSANIGQPSLKLPQGATYVSDPQFISTETIFIIGATGGQTFSVKEA